MIDLNNIAGKRVLVAMSGGLSWFPDIFIVKATINEKGKNM